MKVKIDSISKGEGGHIKIVGWTYPVATTILGENYIQIAVPLSESINFHVGDIITYNVIPQVK